MIFTRASKFQPRMASPRQVANAQRAVAREADSMALFPDLCRVRSAEEKLAQLDRAYAIQVHGRRSLAARQWRWARRILRTLPATCQQKVWYHWNHPTWHPPREAAYFADLVRCEARQLARSLEGGCHAHLAA